MGLSAGNVLIGLAAILSGVGWIWLTVVAFRSGEKIWGWLMLASLILPIGPFVAIAFMVMHWSIARRPAILLILALPLALLGMASVFRAGAKMAEELAETPPLVAPQDSPEAADRDSDGGTTASPREPQPSAPPPAAPPRHAPPSSPAGHPTSLPSVPIGSPPRSEPIRPGTELDRDPARPPVELEVLEIGEPSPNQLRRLRVRARNEDPRPVHEIKIEVEYLDRRGVRLGRWTTVHGDTNSVLAGASANEFEFQAFFVPQFTKNVRLGVEGVLFADGSRWPSLD